MVSDLLPGFKVETLVTVDYNDLETLIKKHLGIDYEIVAYEERGNDTNLSVSTDRPEWFSDSDKEEVEEMIKSGKPKHWQLNNIMDYMTAKGIIPQAEYIIKISW